MILDKEKDYADILEIIDSMEGHKFEDFCAVLLENNGFRDVTVTRGSGDYGVDITARYHNRIYGIQCKRYAKTVGIHAVRDALGGYDYYNCDIVAVLTNSTFTPQAVTQANISGVKLWDRKSLIDFIDNCKNLDFVGDYKDNINNSNEITKYQSAERICSQPIEKVRVKNYTILDGGIYISNKKCSRTFVNIFRLFCLVSGIVIATLSILMLLITPVSGIFFSLFGVFLIIHSKKMKKVIAVYDNQYGRK